MHLIMAAVIALGCASIAAVADTPPAANHSLRQLRFSPDGRYVLTQDDAGIVVLSVHPFAVLFHIRDENASAAQFTPDSQTIVFITSRRQSDGRDAFSSRTQVERWNIEEGYRGDYKGIISDCGTEVLSPDGLVLSCVDFQGTLWLIDVTSGQTIFEMKKLNKPDMDGGDKYSQWLSGKLGLASITFSPDGHFLAAGRGGNPPMILDIRTKKTVKLPVGLKCHVYGFCIESYMFLGRDRIMLMCRYSSKHGILTARIISLPSGKVESEPKLPEGRLFQAADPRFAIVRVYKREKVYGPNSITVGWRFQHMAAVELATGRVAYSDTSPIDVFDRYIVAQRDWGVIGLYEVDPGVRNAVVAPLATVALPTN